MKRLTLVRHAKAEGKGPHSRDFERALTRRGHEEAEALAQRLLEHALIPDLLIASPAQRTKQTAEILALKLGLAADRLQHEKRLYLADSQDLLRVVQSAAPKAQHLMIVGHNPGLSELATFLTSGALPDELATGEACSMTFMVQAWSDIRPDPVQEVRRV